MIFVVHGQDYSKSRKIIVNQQNKLNVTHKVELLIEETSPAQLLESVSSFDIFGTPPFVIFNISKAANLNVDRYVEVAKKTPVKSTLIILSNKTLTKTNPFIKSLNANDTKIVENTLAESANIFTFVDNLFSKNRMGTYQELTKLLIDDNDPFYIFSMILYGLRNVTHAKFGSSEFEKKSPFVRTKALSQAKNFTHSQLQDLFVTLYTIDKDLKTGKISPDIVITYTLEKILHSNG